MSLLSLNDPRAPSGARQPRVKVTLNGTLLTGVVDVEVTNATHFTADTFRVTLATSGLPTGYGANYWDSSTFDQIGIAASLDGTSYVNLILGQVDSVDYDLTGRQIILAGRDLSASLIDTKTSEKFVNQKSYQIAQTLALRHGLDSNVQETSTAAGTYYNIDHVVLTNEQTEWDLLIYLAQYEGFDVWVSGQTLHFQPSPVQTATPYTILWQEPSLGPLDSNANRIRLSRSETLAKDVIVTVISFNQQAQTTYRATSKLPAAKSQRFGGKAQTYVYRFPNLSKDQCQKRANDLAQQIARHERLLIADLPGDNLLTTRAMVQLTGTNTAWDQFYYPDTVTRRLNFQEGYRMELRAKNHSPRSQVTL